MRFTASGTTRSLREDVASRDQVVSDRLLSAWCLRFNPGREKFATRVKLYII